MAWVAGVDGCRAGWVVALIPADLSDMGEVAIKLCPRFEDVLDLPEAPTVIAVDVPIGLLDEPARGGRLCDQYARQLLKGTPRTSSVFSPPVRRMLSATTYNECRPGLSRQAFGILPKIAEVDGVVTPEMQRRVYEVHPEVSFYGMAGQAMMTKKSKVAGRQERLAVLRVMLGRQVSGLEEAIQAAGRVFRRDRVEPDDVLDACAAAWSARRIAGIQAARTPDCERDSRGLDMAIWW